RFWPKKLALYASVETIPFSYPFFAQFTSASDPLRLCSSTRTTIHGADTSAAHTRTEHPSAAPWKKDCCFRAACCRPDCEARFTPKTLSALAASTAFICSRQSTSTVRAPQL